MVSIWLFVLLLAILYDHMIMYVGLFGHSAVVFHVLCFFMFLCFTDCLYRCVFFSDILLIYSAVWLPVCLINLLTYLTLDTPLLRSTFIKDFADLSCNETTDETTDALLLFYFASAPAIWLRHHPLRGVDSVRLQILLTGTRPQCGSWSVAGHFHRKVIGRDSICAS